MRNFSRTATTLLMELRFLSVSAIKPSILLGSFGQLRRMLRGEALEACGSVYGRSGWLDQ